MKLNSFSNKLLLLVAATLVAVLVSACQQTAPGGERGGAGVPSPTPVPPALTGMVTPRVPLSPSLVVTPAPAVTQAPMVTPTATISPTAAPAQAAECRTKPVRSFGKIYSENPNVARAVGCPLEAEKTVYSAEEFFQNGYMFWRNDTRQIYAIMSTGRWAVFPDTFVEGEPTAVPTAPAPPGMMAPVRGFGKIWWGQKDVRETLGWATGRERGFDGTVQAFEKGTMLWSDGRFIFVLFSDGTWLRFEDTFRG